MKNRWAFFAALVVSVTFAQSAWAQWSSDPSLNLALADKLNNDQVQPKVKPLPNGQWYVSWFDNDPNAPGYSVYLQRLDSNGVEQFAHDGLLFLWWRFRR